MSYLISVVIPAKNRPRLTLQALHSVINQNLPTGIRMEIIIIDAHSAPPLSKLLKNLPTGVKLITSRRHDSPGGTRNFGLTQITGQYVCFLDNDDQLSPNFIKESFASLQLSQAPASVCLTSPFFTPPFPLRKRLTLLFLNFIRTFLLFIFYIFNSKQLPQNAFYLCQISHMLFDRKQIKGVQFNENVIAAEDWEYFADITKNKNIRIVPKPLLKFRYSIGSHTNMQKVNKKKWKAYKDLLERLPTTYRRGIMGLLFRLYIKTFS